MITGRRDIRVLCWPAQSGIGRAGEHCVNLHLSHLINPQAPTDFDPPISLASHHIRKIVAHPGPATLADLALSKNKLSSTFSWVQLTSCRQLPHNSPRKVSQSNNNASPLAPADKTSHYYYREISISMLMPLSTNTDYISDHLWKASVN